MQKVRKTILFLILNKLWWVSNLTSKMDCMLEAKRSLLSLSEGTRCVSNLASNGL